MKNDIKNMSIEEIFKKVGKILTPENVFYILKADYEGNEYEEFYLKIKNNPKKGRELLYQYIIDNEEIMDKEVLVLLTLQNYIEYRKNLEGFDAQQRYMYENRIEVCKRMLDNIDVSTYGYIEDTKTGIVQDIVEISSVELCAEERSNLFYKSSEQAKINKQRQDRCNLRRQNNKKNIIRKQRRLSEIERDFDLKNILQFINLSDYEDIIITDKKVSGIIKNMILKNGVVRDLNLDYKGIQELLMTDKFHEKVEKVETMTFMEETEKAMKSNIQFFDLDKMLLCSAFRAVERVSFEEFNPQEIDNIKTILLVILNRLQGKNVKLVGTLENTQSQGRMNVEYDIDRLKKDIMRFADKGLFLTEEKIENIRNILLSGEKNLKEFNSDVIWQLDFEDVQWDKLVKRSSENFIFFLEECEPSEEDIKEVISELKEISTECLYELIQRGSITKNEIIEECNGEKIKLEQLIELASADIIDDKTIMNVFNNLKKLGDEKLLNREELLKYFDLEKIKEYINNNKIDDEFLEFYTKIIPEGEEKKNEILKQIEELVLNSDNKEALIKFYKFGLIAEELLRKELTDEDVFELYEYGKIDASMANQIHKLGIIEQDTMAVIVDEEYKNGDILKGLEDGVIDLKIALELYSDKKVFGILKKYQDGIFKTSNPAIFAFITSNMDLEDLDKLYKKGIVKEQDLKNIILQGNISKTKITELYVNMLISEEIIDELNKNGIITMHDTELMKKALGMKNIVKNMDKSLGIAFGSEGEIEIDDGIFLPEEKAGKIQREWNNSYFPDGNRTKKIKTVISPAIRERKFEMYGAKRIKRNNVEYNEKSPFNDYEFYIIPDEQGNITPDCIVIAERYYKDKYSGEEKLIDNNATYLFELKDLTRISKKSKTEILSEMKEAKDKRMKRKSHTKNWSKNMDKDVEELLGRKLESCYSESEIHDIRTISELIDGFKDKDKDKDKIYRIFDVEIN